jgi:hypothetical protein
MPLHLVFGVSFTAGELALLISYFYTDYIRCVFVACRSDPRRCHNPSVASVVFVVAGAVLSIFFAIFVIAMACDQYEGVTTNTTAIESMKSWTEEQRPFLQVCASYCD